MTVAYTGELTMTGARIARAAHKYLGNAEVFGVTYGDGLCDADLEAELEFHTRHGRIGTMLGSAGACVAFRGAGDGCETVVDFAEKPQEGDAWINGGYFLFERNFLNYFPADEDCVLENEPLAS